MYKNSEKQIASETTSLKVIQYDGTNFLEFSTSLKRNLGSNPKLAIVVPMLTSMTPYNPEDDKLRLHNTYESMVAMSNFDGVEEDEEWISLVKQQMISEGVNLSDIEKEMPQTRERPSFQTFEKKRQSRPIRSRERSEFGVSQIELEEDVQGINLDAATIDARTSRVELEDDESSLESEFVSTYVRNPMKEFSKPKDASTAYSRLKARSIVMTNAKFIKVKLQPWLKTRLTVTHAELNAATKQSAEDAEKFRSACREVVIRLTSTAEAQRWVSTSILRKLEDGIRPSNIDFEHEISIIELENVSVATKFSKWLLRGNL